MTEDTELLQHYVQDRSDAAFEQLVRRHIDLVYSSALRRVGNDPQLAEDVAQEVFLELARKGKNLLGRSTLGSWLYTTSRYKAIDVVRRETRRRAREQESLCMNADQKETTGSADWERIRPFIDEAMDSLGNGDREILVLRYFENRSFAYAAEIFGTTEDAARMRTNRALEHLRAVLAKRGVTSAAEVLALILADKAVGAAPGHLAPSVTGAALASTKAAAASGAHLIPWANGANLATGAATVALLFASAATAIYETKVHRRTADALAETQQSMAADQIRLKDLGRRLKEADQAAVALQASIDSAGAALEADRATRAMPVNARSSGRDLVSRYPGAPTLIVGHEMAHDTLKYGALFSSLGLSSEQQQEFLKLMASRSDLGLSWYTAEDTSAATGEIGTGMNDLSPDEFEAQLRGLLGLDGYQKYQEFNRMSGAQTLVQQLAANLYATDTPITAAQGNQLVQVLAQSSPDYLNGKGIWGPSQVNWETALANAQPLLADTQLAALKNLRQTTAYEDAVNAASNQAAGAAIDAAEAAAKSTP